MKTMKYLTTITLAAVSAAVLLSAAPAHAATYHLKEEISYVKEGKKWVKDSTTTYGYDSKGRETSYLNTYREWVRWDEEAEKAVYKSRSFGWKTVYDSKGRVIKETSTTDGKETSRTVMSYGKTANTYKHYSNKKYTGKTIYTLNKSGRWTIAKGYNAKNVLVETTRATYDKHGNITKYVTKDKSGKVTQTTTYKYTYKNNKVVKEVYDTGDGTGISTYYTNGYRKTWKYSDKKKTMENSEKYDSKGRTTYSSYKDLKSGYSNEITYKNGYPVKEISKDTYTDDNGKKVTNTSTYTFKTTFKSGRATEHIRYQGNDAVTKTTYKYVKI